MSRRWAPWLLLGALATACGAGEEAKPRGPATARRTAPPAPPGAAPDAVVGRVVDALGEPLGGCSVALRVAADPLDVGATTAIDLASTRTDGDGRFAFEPPSRVGDPLVLVVRHPRLPPLLAALAPSVPRTPRDVGDLVLSSAIGAVVDVTRADPVGPVADARISISPVIFDPLLQDAEPLRRAATTGPDGRASIYGLTPGTYRARVEASGLATVEVLHVQPVAPPAPPELRIRMVPGQRLSGRVVDADGRPARGARIDASPAAGDGPTTATRAGEDAAFRLTGLSPGRCAVRAVAEGGVTVVAVDVPHAEPLALRLAAVPPALGTVVGSDGAPIGRAQVALVPLESAVGDAVPVSVWSRADGGFRFDAPLPGRYALEVTSNGRVPIRTGPIDLPSPAPIEVRMEPDRPVGGRVLDASGRPLPGAEIRVMPASFDGSAFARLALPAWSDGRLPARRADPAGAFRAAAPTGAVRLLIRAPGHAPVLTKPIEAGDVAIEIEPVRLPTGAEVRGVVRRDGGRAITGLVCADPIPDGGPDRMAAESAVAADGSFTLGRLSAGPYEVFYYSPARDRPARDLARDQVENRTSIVVHDGAPISFELRAR